MACYCQYCHNITTKNARDASNDIHIGNLSYTEDNVLIYKIYVSNIAPEVATLDLRHHFERFGEISSLEIITTNPGTNKKKPSAFRFAIITYKKAESASKALRDRSRFLSSRKLTVRSAYSWIQPFQDQTSAEQETKKESNKIINNLSLLILNDDVLYLIFKYLSFQDHINLSKICSRFENILKLFYKVNKSLKIDKHHQLTLMDFRSTLHKIDEHIEEIEFDSNFPFKDLLRFMDVISQFCYNLKYLKLNSLRLQYTDTARKISQIKTLKVLQLRESGISDGMINFLSRIKTLENLDSSFNYKITGLYLDKFLNLKRLILNYCHNIQPGTFVRICSKLKQIKELDICHCYRLNNNDFDAIVKHLQVLETLTISTFYQTSTEKISEIKSLKHLKVNYSEIKIKNQKLWQKLADNKSDKLETLIVINFMDIIEHGKYILQLKKLKRLDLPFVQSLDSKFFQGLAKLKELKYLAIPNCESITKNDLLEFIKKSSSIEELNVIIKISKDFISELIKILEQLNRKELRLFVESTITKAMEEPLKNIATNNLLKIYRISSTYKLDYIVYDTDYILPSMI